MGFAVFRNSTIPQFLADASELSKQIPTSLRDAARHPAMFKSVARIRVVSPCFVNLWLRTFISRNCQRRNRVTNQPSVLVIQIRSAVPDEEARVPLLLKIELHHFCYSQRLVSQFIYRIAAEPPPGGGIVKCLRFPRQKHGEDHGQQCKLIYLHLLHQKKFLFF